MGTVPGHCHGFLGPHFAVDWFKVSHDPPLERMNGLRLPRGVTRSPSGIFAPLSVQLRNVNCSVATASSGVFAFTSAVKFSRRMFDCCYLSSFFTSSQTRIRVNENIISNQPLLSPCRPTAEDSLGFLSADGEVACADLIARHALAPR